MSQTGICQTLAPSQDSLRSIAVLNLTVTHPTTQTRGHHSDTVDSVLETGNEEEILEEGNNEEETVSGVFQILDNMENGQIDDLPRTSAEDVAFDMDEVVIEDDDFYTDGTTDSDNNSDVSLEDFEL